MTKAEPLFTKYSHHNSETAGEAARQVGGGGRYLTYVTLFHIHFSFYLHKRHGHMQGGGGGAEVRVTLQNRPAPPQNK